ncbi:MAG: diphthine synthase [Candidatus Hadarchaeales archaeon]
MLVFVGLGLTRGGISVEGLEEAKTAAKVYAELYTSIIPGLSKAGLEEILGRPVEVVDRKKIEENPEEILSSAKSQKVVLLVPGDPMIATTHVDLKLRAEKRGVKTKVLPAGSIISAAPGAAGLQSYKFGASATIPFEDNISSRPYDVLADNLARGLHTLLLLDLRVEERRAMTINEGLKVMLELERRFRKGVFTEDTLVVGVARAGSEDGVVVAGKVRELLSRDFGPPPHVLIVPGNLHFLEAEALQIFGGMKASAERFITPAEMRQIEERAEARGVPRLLLMENAGKTVADFISEKGCGKVVVVAGTGDNGGDGFVAARYLASHGASVQVFLVGDEGDIKSERARLNWNRLKQLEGIQLTTIGGGFLEKLATALSSADVVVDAIFGTGLKGEIMEPHASVIDAINSSGTLKVAVDVPSGLDQSSGKIFGKAVKADVTITFHRPKIGLRERPDLVGELIIADIGIPMEADEWV